MKKNSSIVISLLLMVVVAALYRVIPNRAPGFAPQLAIAVFAGAIFIKDKKWAFVLPVLSMFLSDLLYQGLYSAGLSSIPGFYEGQWQNYLLFAGMASFGFLAKKIKVLPVLLASVGVTVAYFILSNFIVWAGWQGTRGLGRPRTWAGLMLCYNDALPFYINSLTATLVFSTVLFGSWYWLQRRSHSMAAA